MADKKINGSLEITGKLNPNSSGKGLSLPDTSSFSDHQTIATTADITTAIQALPEPMVFKGGATITKSGSTYTVAVTTPSTASDIKEGYTYKITSAPASDTNFKAGDTLVANQNNPGTNPQSNWTLIPSGDEPSGTVTSVATGVGLTGGPITSTGTIKAALVNETKSAIASSYTAAASGDKFYAVQADKDGKLGVRVPWTDNNDNYYATSDFTSSNGTKIATGYSSGTASTTYDLYAPNATASQAGLVTTGAQTFAGAKTLKATLYSDVNDINFVGKQGKIGFRAYKPNTTDNAGQILITSDGTVSGSYRLSIQAYNKTKSDVAGSAVYNTLRVGDSEGLTYKIGSDVLLQVNDSGTVTVAADPINNLDVATKQYVDNKTQVLDLGTISFNSSGEAETSDSSVVALFDALSTSNSPVLVKFGTDTWTGSVSYFSMPASFAHNQSLSIRYLYGNVRVSTSADTGFQISIYHKNSSTLTIKATKIPLDANLVHKSGNETIAGIKTFTGQVYFNGVDAGAVESTTGYYTTSGYYLADSSDNVYQFIPDNTNHTIKVDIPTIGPNPEDVGGEILFPRKSGTIALEPESKTYTGLYTSGTDAWKNANFYFINVKPDSWQGEWSVQYRLECDPDSSASTSGYNNMHSTHECFISGARGLFSSYAYFNNINNTSYRPLGYHAIAKTTEAGFNAGYGHKLGISLYYNGLAWSATSSSSKRQIKVTIVKTVGCTATFESAPLISHNSDRSDYTKLNSTYYPYSSSDSNTAGYMSVFNAYSNGLQETSDDNSVDRLYYHNQYSNISSTMGLSGYSMFGYDPSGTIQPISLYQSGYTSYTASISTTRIYNTTGFDWSRGLVRWVSSGFYAAGTTNVNIHADKVNVFDFRYTDNCITTADTTLSFVRNKDIYLRGTIGSDGLFYLAPLEVTYNSATYKRAWTQDIPSTEDGYVYWLIGHPYSTDAYQLRVYAENTLFWYKDGKFRKYFQPANASLSGVVTTGAQTFAGAKTFRNGIITSEIQNDGAIILTNINNGSVSLNYESDVGDTYHNEGIHFDINVDASFNLVGYGTQENQIYYLPENSGTLATTDDLSGFISSSDSSITNEVTLTLAQYNALATKDNNTIYNITDDAQVGENVDTAPTENSGNLITSGGVYDALYNGNILSLDATEITGTSQSYLELPIGADANYICNLSFGGTPSSITWQSAGRSGTLTGYFYTVVFPGNTGGYNPPSSNSDWIAQSDWSNVSIWRASIKPGSATAKGLNDASNVPLSLVVVGHRVKVNGTAVEVADTTTSIRVYFHSTSYTYSGSKFETNPANFIWLFA